MEICPFSVDIGNLAEWAGVLVAVYVGYRVYKLTEAANRSTEAMLQLTRHVMSGQKHRVASRIQRDLLRALQIIQTARFALTTETGKDKFRSSSEYRIHVYQSLASIFNEDLLDSSLEIEHLDQDQRNLIEDARNWFDQIRQVLSDEKFHPELAAVASISHYQLAIAVEHLIPVLNAAYSSLNRKKDP